MKGKGNSWTGYILSDDKIGTLNLITLTLASILISRLQTNSNSTNETIAKIIEITLFFMIARLPWRYF